MGDSERRYEPTIDLQGFDLTMNMDAIHEPSRLPLVVVIALVVLAAFAGVVWLAYTQGVQRGRESVSRELTAQQLWKPGKPAAPAYTGLKIYEPPSAVEPAAKGKSSSSVVRSVTNAIPSLRPTATAVPDSLATAAAGHVGSPTALQKAKASSGEPPIKPAAAVAAKAPVGEPPIRAATPVSARVATRAPTELTKPAAVPVTTHPLTEPDSLAPAPATAPPSKPAAAPPASPPVRKPTVAAPLVPASASMPAPAATHTAVSGILLQIGSYKSDAEAHASWQAFKSRHDAAAAYQSDVKEVDLGAKGTWYRLRMGPFPDKSSALEACRKLKADGASCLLAQ